MFFPTLLLAIRNLLLHKLRSALTLLGTILGVASVIAMLSIGEGSKQEALEQIRRLFPAEEELEIARGDNHHAASQPVRPQVPLDEFIHFAAALADQSDDNYIG